MDFLTRKNTTNQKLEDEQKRSYLAPLYAFSTFAGVPASAAAFGGGFAGGAVAAVGLSLSGVGFSQSPIQQPTIRKEFPETFIWDSMKVSDRFVTSISRLFTSGVLESLASFLLLVTVCLLVVSIKDLDIR